MAAATSAKYRAGGVAAARNQARGHGSSKRGVSGARHLAASAAAMAA